MADYTQWSTLGNILGKKPDWVPVEDQERIAAYTKYDQIYWNDPNQYQLRVLEGESPLYIPTARKVADTTASFIMKDFKLTAVGDPTTQAALDMFLDREMFYPNFHTAKHAGVVRGDYFFHMVADPRKPLGKRISLVSVDPSMVFPIFDDDDPDRMVACHIAQQYVKEVDGEMKNFIRRLTYRVEYEGQNKRISREEGIFSIEEKWYGPKAKLVEQVLPYGLLDAAIQTIPIYWFKNRAWDGELFGSSDMRGLESMGRAISQSATDVNMALALEGLGVYATDGGRPVNDQGAEVAWEVAPGRVMEVPSGSYFRRVEGVGSITPAKEHIDYVEDQFLAGGGITAIALGQADVSVAQSGIALAIKFMPTLAKVQERDNWASAKMKQMFYDWKIWHQVFEKQSLTGEIIVELGDKLPMDRTARLNELNNMLDRRVISREYYRKEAEKMGYTFPDDIESQIAEDIELANAAASSGEEDSGSEENQSNNASRPNESSGTEATQDLESQATGGTPS